MKRAAKKLKKARQTAGLTQNDLARLCKVSQPLVSQCESGIRPIYPALRRRFAKYLRLDESDLQSMTVTEKAFYTPAELCERWQINPGHLYKLVAKRQLKAIKIGKYLRFPSSEVERFEQQR